ncbi:MAG: NADH-quinone oxidoreductase subunit L [Ulvibacter sp.]|jgi:NADH-quinone oxidoreductase subunit L
MLIKLIVFLPLIGAIISGLFSKQISDKFSQIFNSSLLLLSAIFSTIVFFQYGVAGIKENIHIVNWMSIGTFSADWSLKIDSLSSVMLIVVTYVSSLVHIYSAGYMKGDKSIPRFMSYLSLFTFFMLILVTADNFLQLFVGWEGVGLASYLLIGFYHHKLSANLASMKAFIVNRVSDFGFVLGIALLFLSFGSVEFSQIFSALSESPEQNIIIWGLTSIDIIAILLFIGAMGKSAQIILHVWLADAMEGPTPVSALIHAATMVTAGVFLIARCSPIFENSQIALNFITIIGATTAIFAATIALTQNDIKKIIAYSTCSQLGYMFFACGVGAYSAGIFHLFTHAFFKALLFLGAGAVIYALHHEQDIRKMGGIAKKLPITTAVMWIGSLALVGLPPFAGFYSKDMILEAAYMSNSSFGPYAFYMGILAAFLTAFYSWRLLFVVFHGKTNMKEKDFNHVTEVPKVMSIPLILLAIASVAVGFIGYKFWGMVSEEGNFFSNAIFLAEDNNILEEAHHAPLFIKLLPVIVSILAILLAYLFYIAQPKLPKILAEKCKILHKISFNKYYFDEIYDIIFVKTIQKLSLRCWKFWDSKIIDGVPNLLASICKNRLPKIITKIQTGYVYDYSLILYLGVIMFIFIFMFSLKLF